MLGLITEKGRDGAGDAAVAECDSRWHEGSYVGAREWATTSAVLEEELRRWRRWWGRSYNGGHGAGVGSF